MTPAAPKLFLPKVNVMQPDWREVRSCFSTDDGSLPSIEICNLTPSGLSAIYGMLRRRSEMHGASPEYWSNARETSVLVDAVPDAAWLVATGEATPFHHCVEGVVVGGVPLPVLGVFVFSDMIELNYRMGAAWGEAEVKSFFELLGDCCALDANAVIVPSEREGPPDSELFRAAWTAYIGTRR